MAIVSGNGRIQLLVWIDNFVNPELKIRQVDVRVVFVYTAFLLILSDYH